jgi:hypothetical protein
MEGRIGGNEAPVPVQRLTSDEDAEELIDEES